MNEDINAKRQLTIVYSRVVGWLTPVKNYNPGKASEFKDRKTFIIDNQTDNQTGYQTS